MTIETPKESRGEGEERWTPERIEAFWSGTQEGVKQNLLTIFGSRFEQLRQGNLYEEAEIQEKIEEAMGRERSFVVSVLSRLYDATEKSRSERVLLFDIDETIGTPDFPDDNTLITILRPSLMPLLSEISAPNLRIGFLSTRGKEAMEQQLQDPQHLAPLRQYIDPAYVYSARGERELMCRFDELGEKLKEEFGGESGVIDEDLLGRDGEHDYPRLPGDQVKLRVLKKMRGELEGKAVVVVDDFSYPKYLNTKNGFYGVALREKDGAFFKP